MIDSCIEALLKEADLYRLLENTGTRKEKIYKSLGGWYVSQKDHSQGIRFLNKAGEVSDALTVFLNHQLDQFLAPNSNAEQNHELLKYFSHRDFERVRYDSHRKLVEIVSIYFDFIDLLNGGSGTVEDLQTFVSEILIRIPASSNFSTNEQRFLSFILNSTIEKSLQYQLSSGSQDNEERILTREIIARVASTKTLSHLLSLDWRQATRLSKELEGFVTPWGN